MPPLLLLQATRPTAAVRDTIASVFRQRDYDRSVRDSLLGRAWDWVMDHLQRALDAIGRAPGVSWTMRGIALALLVAFVARLAYVAWLRRTRDAELTERGTHGRAARGGDAWRRAQQLAAAGDYTAAAHALYASLLETIARRERIRLHPSKTVGDYVRELRQRSSALFARFRDFARVYEVVIYGVGECDQPRWERLHALATEIVGPRG